MSNLEEQKPLMQREEEDEVYKGEKEPETKSNAAAYGSAKKDNEAGVVPGTPVECGGIVIGEPVVRSRQSWSTGLFCCLGNNDEFVSSDLEVCVLGCVAPCVLYGTTMERLYPGQATFTSHCMAYSSLLFMGHFLFNGNILAPCFSFPSRTALRQSYNLEGHAESLVNTTGCCSSLIQDEEKLERCEAMLDFTAHICCHRCSLCQEGREIRRRGVHPAHMPRSYMTMAPPAHQFMSPPQ